MTKPEAMVVTIEALKIRARYKADLAEMCLIDHLTWMHSGHFKASKHALDFGMEYVNEGIQNAISAHILSIEE